MKVYLQVVEGPETGRSFVFETRDRFLIGRAPTAHFQITNDQYFSRHHAMLEVNPPNVLLQDLRSTNGTRVNNAPIAAPTALQHGDTISGGQTRMQIALEDDALRPTELPGGSAVPVADGPKVAVRCGSCGVKASNELPRSRVEKMAYFCDGCQAKLLAQPKLLPGYQVLKELGRGGMGAVYLASHPVLGRRAIKMILPKAAMSERVRQMFVREATSQAQLDHPRVVRVLDFQETAPGIFCMVMEFVEGTSADKLVEQHPTGLDPRFAAEIIAQGLEGLGHAHERGLVHRDVKEANLLVTKLDHGIAVKLTDFGLAKSYETSGASGFTRTQDGATGTLPYMAPEQILNYRDVKPAADLYSMGAALYHMLTNEYAYNFRREMDPFVTILEESVIPVLQRKPSVPPAIARVVDKAMQKDPAQRYRTADEMRAALTAAFA